MPVPRKRSLRSYRQVRLKQMNGLYVHSSPPRVLSINSAHLKQLIRSGDVERLESLVYEGQGRKLLTESSPDPKVKNFLKNLPILMSKISQLHDAVNSGRLDELQALLEDENEKTRKRLIVAKDDAGVGLLHKAIYYDLKSIAEWIVKNYPHAVQSKDAEGRTPYHYTPMCTNVNAMQKFLKIAGADPTATDNRQKSAKYYKDHISELELPSAHKAVFARRRTLHITDSLNIKKSNIRIWIHQRDLASLQQVIWEGHGSKLLVEHSNNPKVKRFLESCPYILGCIKDVHTDVINDELEAFTDHTAPPAPNVIYIAKDINGLTPLHKAAGLGRHDIAEYIISHNPKSLSCVDNEGRTPLHYSVLLKDGGKMFDYLVEAGADEGALDNKSKSAGFYKTRTNEIDSKLLHVIPDSPRKAKEGSTFDWGILGVAATPLEEMAKVIESNAEEVFGSEETTNGVEEEVEAEAEAEAETETEADVETELVEENNNEEEEKEATNGEPEPEEELPADEETATEIEAEPDAEPETETVDEPADEPEVEVEAEVEPEVEPGAGTEPEEQLEAEVAAEADPETATEVEAEPEPEDEPEADVKPEEPEPEANSTADPEPEVEEEPTPAPTPIDREPTPMPPPSRIPDTEEGELEDKPEEETQENKENGEEEEEEEDETENDKETAIVEPEAVIEGVVNGENEIESVNEQGATKDDRDDAEIANMVASGNMELLAALVLDGDGDRLMGHSSDVPELQSFLDNVPVYMNKINRIHMAARDGSLKELQAALDRRKFAIAKDKISPNGATPLHVATVFGNTSIVRYLAGRFPETVTAVDDNGRTSLHYAAVVPDNGHYYNLLVHLGANARSEDKFGHTPDFYRSNQGEFSHRAILSEYGAEELAEEMLTDKDAQNAQVEMPFFCTEEGRYLASSLGDPLIKGLTEVANKRPTDPIAYLAQYLYQFADNNNRARSRGRTQENQTISEGSPTSTTVTEPAAEVITNAPMTNANIDVVTIDPDDIPQEEESAFSPTSRDEHGQSMLHFAAARSHGRNALFQLLVETNINIGYRDELYRTARDITVQAAVSENTLEIDRYVLQIATQGDTDKLVELLLDGYDHIIDIIDEDSVPISEAANQANQPDTVAFLHSILAFEERRERVHHAIREGNLADIKQMLADANDTGSGRLLAIGKNSYGRCTLHIAVLCQQEEIVDFLANTFPETLYIGDNLDRTALHYAMGIEKIESVSRVLIKAGSKRVAKDLKGRQPTYYFMNKSDILRLQEEEETF